MGAAKLAYGVAGKALAQPLPHGFEVSMLLAALICGHLLGESDLGLRILDLHSIAIGVMALALG